MELNGVSLLIDLPIERKNTEHDHLHAKHKNKT